MKPEMLNKFIAQMKIELADAESKHPHFADGLRKKHKKVLAGNSKALFKEAVKLDQKLKELNDEE